MSDPASGTDILPLNEDPRARRVEIIISNLLRIGVAISMVLIIVGTIVTFVQHPKYFFALTEQVSLVSEQAKFPHSLRELAGGLRSFEGEAIVMLGLFVLIATPVMRVAVSVLAFIYQQDRLYTLITATVLLLLALSVVLGKAG
jgi:uncharacterized membrane protein